jgi:hypothetical protein
MSDDDQRVIDALMAAQRKNRKIIPCPECERLQKGWESLEWESKQEIERLRTALEQIAVGDDDENRDDAFGYAENIAMRLQDIAREALRDD